MGISGHFRFPRQTKFYDSSSIMPNRPHVKENKVTAILWIKLYSWQTNKSHGTNHCCPFMVIQQLRYNERRIYLKRCDLLSLIYYYQQIRGMSVCALIGSSVQLYITQQLSVECNRRHLKANYFPFLCVRKRHI